MLGVQELIIILLIVVLLFGGKRIPEIMSGLGKGIKSFKQAVDGQDIPDDDPSAKAPGSGKTTIPGSAPAANDLNKAV